MKFFNDPATPWQPTLSRRHFVTGVTAGIALGGIGVRAKAGNFTPPATSSITPQLRGNNFDLAVNYQNVNFTGKDRVATCVNGSLPAPTLHIKEGETITLRVKNSLAVDTSIHWHGMVLPSNMDGVPGMSFGGIKPGETFKYRFPVKQSGTYWYHSHSGYQEQTGLYGALIVEPRAPEPFSYDRDYVVMLSDWSDENPETVADKLKKVSHYYNRNERTVADTWRDIRDKGIAATWNERAMWNQMRMSERDISDVPGYTYTFLMNGQTPATGWTGIFNKGETVRLRFINASAMTFFDVRIPGVTMRVIAADGNYIDPVCIDEFRIGIAETYDVLVTPDDGAYTIFAQAIDRSGYARGTLSTHAELMAEIPALDPVPVLTHMDMGMNMDMNANMDMDPNMDMGTSAKPAKNNAAASDNSMSGMEGMEDMEGMSAAEHALMQQQKLAPAGAGSNADIIHASSERGAQVDMQAMSPQYRLDDPGVGLRNNGRRVLTYADLRNLNPTPDPREPTREIQLHLTGNMHRYLWSFDGIPFHEADPILLRHGERVRFVLVNDTMMNHPVHLHGLWSDLETGCANYIPRKHTVIVQPGAKISYLVSADSVGRWAYHCHLMYHMMGMMREVRVE